ncbi:MAG: RraA family protein [Verrucomicrobiota bacterium]
MKPNAYPTELADRLETCYTGALYDVLRAAGYPDQALPSEIMPLKEDWKVAGKIFTVSGHYDSELDDHQTLLDWTKLLSLAPKGSVVICQPNDNSLAHMGELSAETLLLRGIRGYIVDGGCRDSAFIKKIGFKTFSKYTTPVDVVGRWRAESFNESIVIGSVEIHGGDYVLADFDGVVVIPAAIAEEIVSKTEEVIKTENLVRTAILDGCDPQEAYLKYGKF